ncbi:protein of unknown function [Ruminococcaceae bacterium BL-4]|nr:protein of unknown function [Ruminococcaceae bacterium BL-4]
MGSLALLEDEDTLDAELSTVLDTEDTEADCTLDTWFSKGCSELLTSCALTGNVLKASPNKIVPKKLSFLLCTTKVIDPLSKNFFIKRLRFDTQGPENGFPQGHGHKLLLHSHHMGH